MLNSWKRRNLTLYGKINIIKTFGLSKLIYNASVLVIPENFVKEIEKSRPVFLYWKFSKFDEDEWSAVECQTELRFAKGDLGALLECLEMPDKVVCEQRTVCGWMEGLYILLKRLAYPYRYTDMVLRFGRNPAELCLIFNNIVDFLYEHHHHRLHGWHQFF